MHVKSRNSNTNSIRMWSRVETDLKGRQKVGLDGKIGLKGRQKVDLDGKIGLKGRQKVGLEGKIGLKGRRKVDRTERSA